MSEHDLDALIAEMHEVASSYYENMLVKELALRVAAALEAAKPQAAEEMRERCAKLFLATRTETVFSLPDYYDGRSDNYEREVLIWRDGPAIAAAIYAIPLAPPPPIEGGAK